MGRKRAETNKVSGERLRELIVSQNMTQCEFAKKFSFTEQHVSYMVNGKRRLTPDNAMYIAKEYPPTRFEWLMGYDDFQYENSDKIEAKRKQRFRYERTKSYIQTFAKTLGYKIEEHYFVELEELKRISISDALNEEELYEAKEKLSSFVANHENEKYDIYHNGALVMTCGEKQMEYLIKETNDFIKFRLKEMTESEF